MPSFSFAPMAMIIAFMSVILISQSSIVVQNVLTNNLPKDTNFYWSVSVLTCSILALLGSIAHIFFAQQKKNSP